MPALAGNEKRVRKVPSKADLLLEAARMFDGPFTWAELVVWAWLIFPREFGLPGREECPCSHTVSTYLYGSKGLLGTGRLRKTGDGRFEVAGG